jgi:hypothetical protein
MSDARPRKTAAHGVAKWILPVPQFRIPEFAKSWGGGETVVARESVCDHPHSSSSLQSSRDDEWQAAVEQMHLVIFV